MEKYKRACTYLVGTARDGGNTAGRDDQKKKKTNAAVVVFSAQKIVSGNYTGILVFNESAVRQTSTPTRVRRPRRWGRYTGARAFGATATA